MGRAVFLDKAELLRIYPLMREPLCALDKPQPTFHEVLERIAAQSRRSGCVGMAYRRHVLAEMETKGARVAVDVPSPADPLQELLAEVRAMRAMMAAVMGAPVT